MSHSLKTLVISSLCLSWLFMGCPPQKFIEPIQPTSPTTSDAGTDAGTQLIPDSGATPDAGPTTLTMAEFRSIVIPSLCATLDRCYGPEFLENTELSCNALATPLFDQNFKPALQTALAQGSVELNAAHVAQAVEQLASTSCTDSPIFESTTKQPNFGVFVKSKLALDSPCESDFECGNQAFCALDNTCPGQCSPRLTEDSTSRCQSSRQCQSGLVCDEVTESCIVGGREGEPCSIYGRTCLGLNFCEEVSGNATCVPLKNLIQFVEEGEPCNGPVLCKKGFHCASRDSICTKRAASGEACIPGYPNGCPEGEFCEGTTFQNPNGTCRPLPAEGESCGSDLFDNSICGVGLLCDSNQLCNIPQKIGSACDENRQCESGKCSDEQICVVRDVCEE